MNTLVTPTVALDLIHDHEDNPRRNAVADDEMIESVRALGIAQALTVMPYLGHCTTHPDVDCYLLGAGHRRKLAARAAGLTEVPVVYRDDLVTRAQQLAFMVVENLHRVDLTADEEIATYEQMTLEGFGVGDIADLTGRSVATVKSRLKLAALPESTRDRLHTGEMTLLDAETMLEFADDPEATAELEQVIGTSNFRWKVQSLRDTRTRAARNEALIAEFEELGAKPFEFPEGTTYWMRHLFCPLSWFSTDELREPAAHDGHLGYHVSMYTPELVCTDVTQHPEIQQASVPQHDESDWEKERAEREARAARRRAAAAVRVEWLAGHFKGLLTFRGNRALSEAVAAFLPPLITGELVDAQTVLRAADREPEPGNTGFWEACLGYADDVAAAKPAAAVEAFAAYLAALIDSTIDDRPELQDDAGEVSRQLALWDWMKRAGFPFSDVDTEIFTALEVRHTELADGDED